MRTHPHHLRLRFSNADNVKESFAASLVFPFLRKVRREPNAAFHGNGFFHYETSLHDFRFHLLGSREIRLRDELRVFLRTDMIARGHLAFDHVEKHRVVNEVVLLAIHRQSPSHGAELGDARRHQKAAFLQHSECLAERLQAFSPIAQMILWSHQQHHIRALVGAIDFQGVANFGNKTAILHHIGFGIFHCVFGQLKKMDFLESNIKKLGITLKKRDLLINFFIFSPFLNSFH